MELCKFSLLLILHYFCCLVNGDCNDSYVIHSFYNDIGYELFDGKALKENVSILLELVSGKQYYPNVTLHLKLNKVVLDENEGDLLIVGPGNKEQLFHGPPSLMYVESQNTQDIVVIGQNASIVFVPRGETDARILKFEWNRTGTVAIDPLTTPAPTVPVSEADRQAVILCFKKNDDYTCDQLYKESITFKNFQKSLADVANAYVRRKGLDIKRILSENIKVKCLTMTNQPSRNVTILQLTITDRRSDEVPVFSTKQLKEIIEGFDTAHSLGVAECRTYPNYWWWFWGSAIMLCFIIVVLIACWKWSHYEFFNKTETEKKSPASRVTENGYVNTGYKHDNDSYFYDSSSAKEGSLSSSTPKSNHQGRKLPNPPDCPDVNIECSSSPTTPTSPTSPTKVSPKFPFPKAETHALQDRLHILAPTGNQFQGSPPSLSPTTQQKQGDTDSVSKKSIHLYEDLDKLKGLSPPAKGGKSPSISLRRQRSDDFTDTSL